MPVLITKTHRQQREYLRQLDGKKADKILQEVLEDLQTQKNNKTFNASNLKGLNSRFQRQMNKIQLIRNTKNKKYRNKWYTIFHQEKSKLK